MLTMNRMMAHLGTRNQIICSRLAIPIEYTSTKLKLVKINLSARFI